MAVLIYDSACPICSRTIDWIRENAREDAFETLGCGSDAVKKRFPAIRESECMNAMQLVLPDGSVLPGEKALPEVIKRLRRYRRAAAIFKLPGSGALSRVLYRWFAGHRYRIARLMFPGKRS